MRSKPPIIGITTPVQPETHLFCLRSEYAEAVRLAGGVPVLLTPGAAVESALLLERVDGLVLSGGGDIDPSLYNGTPHPLVYNVDPRRDQFELALAQLALAGDIPVLGICRGLEMLVVASGGNLVPHLPDEFGESVNHRASQSSPCEHLVEIAPRSRLATVVGTQETKVVSWHHQAARKVPVGWRVTAKARDGVIEALEHEEHSWAMAVQWHPELSLKDPKQLGIFHSFMAAAKNWRKASC